MSAKSTKSIKSNNGTGKGTPSGKLTPVSMLSQSENEKLSPISPTRYSRLHEKVELQNLNDRLATYIDRARTLESENSRLSVEIQSSRDTVNREALTIKTLYETELADARKLLDETSREKAKLEIDTKRLWEENEDLKLRLEKKIKDLNLAENNARHYEALCTELSGKYNAASSESKKFQENVKELEIENEKLRKFHEDIRRQLEEETLARVDLENNVQSLKEELTFKDGIFQQELNETRSRRQVEMSEIDGRLAEQYEAKLKESLQELREQYEHQLSSHRNEIEMLYETKIKNLQNDAAKNSISTVNMAEDLRSSRLQVDTLKANINELEGCNAALNSRIRDLEMELDTERVRNDERINLLQQEAVQLRDEMILQLQEYQHLMDIKISLDMEIAAYDKLLSGEEFRLNITPSKASETLRTSGRGTPSRKRKRPNTDVAEESAWFNEFSTNSAAIGDIEIVDVDPDGKYVKLHNKGLKEVPIGGWQLIRSVSGNSNETTFKFHRSNKLEPDNVITVWSMDSDIVHEPKTNIVMKSQKWLIGDDMRTVLKNNNGEDVASSERIRIPIIHSTMKNKDSSMSAGRPISVASTNGEMIPPGSEKCSIM